MTIKQKSAFVFKKSIGTEISRVIFLMDLKSNFTSNVFEPCYHGIICKDKNSMLIGLNGVYCKKCSIPIHQKRSISLDLVIRDQYYCCHDCYLGEKMTDDGYPYKCVIFYENEEYLCFLQVGDTIKEILVEFLQIIVGKNFHLHKTTVLK